MSEVGRLVRELSLDVPLKQQVKVFWLTIIPATATLMAFMKEWSLVYIAYSNRRVSGITNSGLGAGFLLFVNIGSWPKMYLSSIQRCLLGDRRRDPWRYHTSWKSVVHPRR